MSLSSSVEELRREIRTDSYPMSLGEWISLYESNELDIHPEFQRFFRWTDTQKTLLIESILLGIPLPSIFVSQRPDGVWDVVDGLQRLSTIFQFLGILRDEKGKLVQPLELQRTDYVPNLQGIKWDGPPDKSLPADLKLVFKRSKLQANIILRESDGRAKYDLFQRLNTGGTPASDQEVRNCILIMMNPELYRWCSEMVKFEQFVETISLSERPIQEAYNFELFLRFLVLYNISGDDLSNVGDIGIFLTRKMKEIAEDKTFDRNRVQYIFESTFAILRDNLSDGAFKKFSTEKGRFMGAFLISQYEVVSCGIAYNIMNGIIPTQIDDKVKSLWGMEEYAKWTGSGITAARRLPKIIPLGRRIFAS